MRAAPGFPSPARALVAGLALCLSCRCADAFCVHIAPIALIDSASVEIAAPARPERLLLKELDAVPLEGSVEFRLADGSLPPPSSFLEAARLCEGLGYSHLIYGYVKAEGSRYFSELKLLSRESKRVERCFLATDDSAHFGRLIGDLRKKIADYFLDELAILPAARAGAPSHKAFLLPLTAGYWSPVGAWAEGMMGVASVGFGFRFFPWYPLGAIRSRPFDLAAGIGAEYALGVNRPGFESSTLHRAIVKAPLEASLGLGKGNGIALALGPLVEFDILDQDRKYGEAFVETRSAGGAFVSLSYRHPLSESLSLGLDFEIEAALYSRPLCAISPRLSLEYSFGEKKTTSEEGPRE
jgi:hypothetical protein